MFIILQIITFFHSYPSSSACLKKRNLYLTKKPQKRKKIFQLGTNLVSARFARLELNHSGPKTQLSFQTSSFNLKAGASVRAGRKYREYSLEINKVKLSYSWELVRTGAHNPRRPTSMCSCHSVFMDQFIFRTVLARILNDF